jgi:hypothetical protein
MLLERVLKARAGKRKPGVAKQEKDKRVKQEKDKRVQRQEPLLLLPNKARALAFDCATKQEEWDGSSPGPLGQKPAM